MKIGVNTIYYKEYAPHEAAERITADGFEAVHLFLDFAEFRHFPFPYEPDRVALEELDPEKCREIRLTFESAGLEIAALGGYTNLIEPDEGNRKRNVMHLGKLIGLAPALGTRIVASESGELPSPEEAQSLPSVERLVRSIQEVVPCLEEHDVTLALEAYEKTTLNSSRRLREVIDRVASDHVKVLLDPGNTFVTDSLEETFQWLGEYIVAAHAKDVVVTKGELGPALMGRGHVDHRDYFCRLIRTGFSGAWILDLTEGEDLRVAREFLERIVGESPGD